MPRNNVFELIDGYTHKQSANEEKRFISKSVTGSFAGKKTNRHLRALFNVTAGLKTLFSYTSTRCYGLFLLSFGLSTLLIHFAKDYLGVYDSVPLHILICGAITAILGVLVVVFDKPLTVFLQEFKATDFILYEFFCIKRTYKRLSARGIPPVLGLLFGIALAALGGVLPFSAVAIVLVLCVYCYVAFLSPEFSLFSTFLVLPYLSYLDNHSVILALFVVLNILSFARKVILGKRVLYIEQYDAYIAIFLVFILVSGIFVKGVESFYSSVVMIILAAGYTLSSCIIANRRLADCLINALISSSIPVSIIAIVQFILFVISNPVSSFTGVGATFSSPSVLAIFLLVAYVFSLYRLRARGIGGFGGLLHLSVLFLTVIALALTYNMAAIAVAILVIPLYIILRTVRPFVIVLLLLALLPSLLICIPESFITSSVGTEWLEIMGLDALVTSWGYAKTMLTENIFTGIGMGSECFSAELVKLAGEGLEFTDASHFLIEIAIEAGIFALIAFVLIIFIRIRHTSVYLSYTRNSQLSLLSPFNTLALAALLLFGASSYLWADMSMYFLFWCVFGIGSATLRISRQEQDDRMGYYSDGRSADASSIDIEIS